MSRSRSTRSASLVTEDSRALASTSVDQLSAQSMGRFHTEFRQM
jgi:hypothetical protein